MTDHFEATATDLVPHDRLVTVEVVPSVAVSAQQTRGVTLRGEAAVGMRDSLGSAAALVLTTGRRAVKGRRAAVETTYRLSPPEGAIAGLKDKSLEWVVPRKGDASVKIRDAASGRFVGDGTLHKVKPNPARLLTPALVFEAMAIASQQHYLVEITDQLTGIETGVNEVLQRMDDDKRGTLKQLRKVVDSTRRNLADGQQPSPARRAELQQAVLKADDIWHQLNERVVRHLAAYRTGASTAEDLEDSWAMLLFATGTLCEAGEVLTRVPFNTAAALAETTAEERDRVLSAVDAVRMLASDLHAAHLDWSDRNAAYVLGRTRNPAKLAVRAARNELVAKPAVAPIDYTTAWRASQLAIEPPPPAAFLVTVLDGDRVEVVAEPIDRSRR